MSKFAFNIIFSVSFGLPHFTKLRTLFPAPVKAGAGKLYFRLPITYLFMGSEHLERIENSLILKI
jgi:hypothetical protein